MKESAGVHLAVDDALLAQALEHALGARGVLASTSPPAPGALIVLGTDLVHLLERCEVHVAEGRDVLFLVDSPDDELLVRGLEAGALGFVDVLSSLDEFELTVRGALRGEACVPRRLLGPVLRGLVQRRKSLTDTEHRLASLTVRELEVLSLLGQGEDHRGIARSLVISPETARTHIQRLLPKLGAHNRVRAAELAREHGLYLADELQRRARGGRTADGT